MMQGFSRVEFNGETFRIQDMIENKAIEKKDAEVFLLIDRLTVDRTLTGISRLTDSVETAFYEGKGVCILKVFGSDETQTLYFSKSFEADGMQFETPTVHTFSFNSPLGACPVCEGFGRVIGIVTGKQIGRAHV